MVQTTEDEELEAGCWAEAEIKVARHRRSNRTSLSEDKAIDIGCAVAIRAECIQR
jgi:hypothetical protein